MDLFAPEPIDQVVSEGMDSDGSSIPHEMLSLYRESLDKEIARKLSGINNQSGIMLFAMG